VSGSIRLLPVGIGDLAWSLCTELTGEDAIEEECCSASTRFFEYLFCLFPKSVLTAKLKAFSAAAEIYSL